MAHETAKQMHLVTSIQIAAPPKAVWQVVTNPEITSRCMPGLAEWETLIPQHQFRIVVAWGSGERSSGVRVPVLIEWLDLAPPTHMRLRADVSFGSNSLQVQGSVSIQPQTNGKTLLEFTSDVETPNAMIASMVQNVMAKILTPFFRCLRERAEQERMT